MTPKEQTRLQVLNSLLAEHIALDQAAELMGVSTRHTKRILAAYQERGAAALAMVTAAVDRPTLFPRARPRRSPIASTAASSDTIADQPSDISAEHLDWTLYKV